MVLRSLEGTIVFENLTRECANPFEIIVVSHAAQQPIVDVVELGIVALWTLLSSFMKSTSRAITIRRTTLELLQCCSSTCEQNVSSMETWKTANMVRGCSRSETSVCKPQVHLTETTLGEGRGDRQERHACTLEVAQLCRREHRALDGKATSVDDTMSIGVRFSDPRVRCRQRRFR